MTIKASNVTAAAKEKIEKVSEKNNVIQNDKTHNDYIPKQKKKHKFIKDNQFQTTRTLYGLTKDIFSYGKEGISKLKDKKMEREDWIAMGLTAVVVIVLGIILWFIPFTNGWMRQITVDSPFLKWMFK